VLLFRTLPYFSTQVIWYAVITQVYLLIPTNQSNMHEPL